MLDSNLIWVLPVPLLLTLTSSMELGEQSFLPNPGRLFIREILRRWKRRDTERCQVLFILEEFPLQSIPPCFKLERLLCSLVARITESWKGVIFLACYTPWAKWFPTQEITSLLSCADPGKTQTLVISAKPWLTVSLLLPSCVSLQESLNLSVPQYPLKWGKHDPLLKGSGED